MSIDLTAVISTLVAQAPLTVATIAILMLYFEKRLMSLEREIRREVRESIQGLESRVENRFNSLENKLVSLENRVSRLEMRLESIAKSVSGLIDFNEILLSIHVSRGLMSDSEYRSLVGMLNALRPPSSSKYYTKEVYERLGQLLSKGPNEITWDDVFELEKIFDLLIKEGLESNRDDLIKYAYMLRVAIGMAKGFLLKRGVLPPPRKKG